MDIDQKIAQFINTVLNDNTIEIFVSREGVTIDYQTNFIFIDHLISVPYGSRQVFNSDDEMMTHGTELQTTFTIDFLGPDAIENVMKFINLSKSEIATTAQKASSISIYHNGTITDLKELEGKTFFNRFQVEILVQHAYENTIATRFIDQQQVSYIVNKR